MAALTALTAGAALTGLAGCASETGTRDDGVAPSLSPPVSAQPLWPQYAPPTPPAGDETSPTDKRYLTVEGITVPAGGLKKVPVKQLLQHDPNMPKLVLAAMEDCPGSRCGLRRPVYRDLTGDGRDELIVALDEESAGLTLIQVYWSRDGTVRPVLISWGPLGLTGETFGHDLLLTSTGDDGLYTTRYRWNGAVMAAGAPQGGNGDTAGTGGAQAPDPSSDADADPGAAPSSTLPQTPPAQTPRPQTRTP
ncbi:hypothetical protein HRW23_10945 [Streptomyces lunaelactis]|uniref:hypothetical protein n=3 Tax=Streptomyces lunaelactis TaxID=1535768 RepID=UPI001584E8FD|nr:hypothetical protein [Streptomyces lunaelactis]NUK65703.1 hypothetical protein [Streptomyces lunaelactis]NUK77909.1 hypothetical protein [Streptomyces lunaelactis]